MVPTWHSFVAGRNLFRRIPGESVEDRLSPHWSLIQTPRFRLPPRHESIVPYARHRTESPARNANNGDSCVVHCFIHAIRTSETYERKHHEQHCLDRRRNRHRHCRPVILRAALTPVAALESLRSALLRCTELPPGLSDRRLASLSPSLVSSGGVSVAWARSGSAAEMATAVNVIKTSD